jgi:hypothetical protein
MSFDARSAILDVFAQVLEDYAFLFSDTLEAGSTNDAEGPFLNVTMSFHGPFKGTLTLAVPKSFGPPLAANVLGLDLDEPLPESSAADALKELLNVTCGNLLTALAGDEPIFDLTVPEVAPLSQSEWEAVASSPDSVGFLIEDWPAFLQLAL